MGHISFVMMLVCLDAVFGQTSFRPNVRSILCLSAICLSVICLSAICPFGHLTLGNMSFRSHVFRPFVRSVICLSPICPTTVGYTLKYTLKHASSSKKICYQQCKGIQPMNACFIPLGNNLLIIAMTYYLFQLNMLSSMQSSSSN